MRCVSSASLLIVACAALAGCSRGAPASTEPSRQPAVEFSGEAEAAHGSRRKALAGAPVYVDGSFVASLRFGELPPNLEPRAGRPGGPARRYTLTEYLSAVGVDTARLRAVHVRGNGHRISSIEADELQREPDRFVFEFLGTDTGAARVAWDTTGLRNTFRAHEIRDVLVYVDKAAPEVDAKRSCYLTGKACASSVPHAGAEAAKGTRVYVDGRLVGYVKRRNLGDDLVLGKGPLGEDVFALRKLLVSFGVDVASARSVEMVSGDDVVARAKGAELVAREDRAAFKLPRHKSGRVVVTVPAEWQAPTSAPQDREAEVTAVLVYQKLSPRPRPLVSIESELPNSDSTLPEEEDS